MYVCYAVIMVMKEHIADMISCKILFAPLVLLSCVVYYGI